MLQGNKTALVAYVQEASAVSQIYAYIFCEQKPYLYVESKVVAFDETAPGAMNSPVPLLSLKSLIL